MAFSARSLDLLYAGITCITGHGNTRGQQTMLYFKHVAIISSELLKKLDFL